MKYRNHTDALIQGVFPKSIPGSSVFMRGAALTALALLFVELGCLSHPVELLREPMPKPQDYHYLPEFLPNSHYQYVYGFRVSGNLMIGLDPAPNGANVMFFSVNKSSIEVHWGESRIILDGQPYELVYYTAPFECGKPNQYRSSLGIPSGYVVKGWISAADLVSGGPPGACRLEALFPPEGLRSSGPEEQQRAFQSWVGKQVDFQLSISVDGQTQQLLQSYRVSRVAGKDDWQAVIDGKGLRHLIDVLTSREKTSDEVLRSMKLGERGYEFP